MSTTTKKIDNESETDQMLYKHCTFPTLTGFVEVGEDKICLPVYFEEYAKRIRNFQVYDSDVFITGHPKTGTSWAQELVWLLVNNLDYEGAKERLDKRSPQLEFGALFDLKSVLIINQDRDPLQLIETLDSPRCIKTHLHWSLLPEQMQNGSKRPKIITMLRNAYDTCVSYYHFSKLIGTFQGTFEEFCELFLAGKVTFGPYWKQVLSYWEQKDRPNILFIRYKEMKEDLPAVIKKIANFLGKNLTQSQIEKLNNHLSLESMRNNPATNLENIIEDLQIIGILRKGSGGKFLRSGTIENYKSIMSHEMIERFKMWTENNVRDTNLLVE